MSVPAAIGHLHLFWWWAMDYAPDGDITGFDSEEIAVAVMWPGEGDDFIAAMDKCRWTDLTPDGRRVIHDWKEYGGKLNAKREAAKERVRNWRATQTNTDVTHNERITNAQEGVRYTADHTTEQNTTEEKITQQSARAILPADETAAYDRTLELETAIGAARRAQYSQEEIDAVLADAECRGITIERYQPYLLKMCRVNREKVNAAAAPPVTKFSPNRVKRNEH